MTLLEAIATMASEMEIVKTWRMVSIEIKDVKDETDKSLVEARCYPINPNDPVAVFKLTYDEKIVEKKQN